MTLHDPIRSRLRPRGFTLIEIMIVLTFASILLGITIVFGVSAIRLQELDRAEQSIRNELALVRERAMSARADSSWGLAVATSTITEFKGDSYDERDTAYDLELGFANNVRLSGVSEIVFRPPFGNPSASGTIVVTDGENEKTVSVNEYGMIESE